MSADYDVEKNAIDLAAGARIRLFRKMRSMSQPELAAAIGLSFQQVQRYETGESSLSIAMMSKIAQALGMTPTHLLETFIHPNAQSAPLDLDVLSAAGAAELLKAYGALEPKLRAHLLALAQALAGTRSRALRAVNES